MKQHRKPLVVTLAALLMAGTTPIAFGRVTTTQTDAGRFKNCSEPAPGEAYSAASPEEVGLEGARLEEALEYKQRHFGETMKIFRFGCLVGRIASDEVFEDKPQHMWSTTKAVMTLVLGRAVTLGHLSVDDTVGQYFPEAGPEHARLTVRQLLNHTTGVPINWSRDLNYLKGDTVRDFLALPIEHEPGTHWDYSQITPDFTAALVQVAVGSDFQEFAQTELFDRIGIPRDTWFWFRDRAGWTQAWSLLHLRPRDMGRIGLLMLNRGVYHGERLIDEEFMDQMKTGSEANPVFGFNTWVNAAERWFHPQLAKRKEYTDRPFIASAPEDMFLTWGWRGRHIFVIPSLGMVVTATHMERDGSLSPTDYHTYGQGELKEDYHEFFRLLMKAVADQEVPDPGPWNEDWETPLSEGDPSLFVNESNMTQLENEMQNPSADTHGYLQTVTQIPVGTAGAFTTGD